MRLRTLRNVQRPASSHPRYAGRPLIQVIEPRYLYSTYSLKRRNVGNELPIVLSVREMSESTSTITDGIGDRVRIRGTPTDRPKRRSDGYVARPVASINGSCGTSALNVSQGSSFAAPRASSSNLAASRLCPIVFRLPCRRSAVHESSCLMSLIVRLCLEVPGERERDLAGGFIHGIVSAPEW
jgi:hypothetical protein